MMANTRHFCDMEGEEHALVSPTVEVRDNLGTLAVQVLAAKHDLADMRYQDMVYELYEIVTALHRAYEQCGLPA